MRPNWENECVNKSALIEWLRPYLHTGEPIPADVLISDIQMMPPTLTPQNEPLRCTGCMYLDEDFVPCVHCVRAAGYADYYCRPPERQEDT